MIPFVKAHACGNDFLILEEVVADGRHAELARRLCSRCMGIGADGIEFLDRRGNGEFFLRLFNSDGSEAELSGNGTRCVAAWLARSEGLSEVALETHGGVRMCRLIQVDGAQYWIESDMGVPRIQPRVVELPGVGAVAGAYVDVGNPHFVLFVERDDFVAHGLGWQALGRLIAESSAFPRGVNVEFVHLRSPGEIAFRIFERGAGPTSSSGTGTCASAAAAIVLRGGERRLTVISEGGAQRVEWLAPETSMLLTGPAEIVCQGSAFGVDAMPTQLFAAAPGSALA